jgi:hypothetical protein
VPELEHELEAASRWAPVLGLPPESKFSRCALPCRGQPLRDRIMQLKQEQDIVDKSIDSLCGVRATVNPAASACYNA